MKRGLIAALSLFLLLGAGGLALYFSPAQRGARALNELAEGCDVPFLLTAPSKDLPATDRAQPLRYVKGPVNIVLGVGEDLDRTVSLAVSIAVTNREGVVF